MRTWKCGAVLALALAACGGKATKDTGSLSMTISGPGLGAASGASQALASGRAALTTPAPDAASRVASVVLTHTGPDGGGTQTFTTITNPITQLYNALPVGVYTFSATAYDASDPPVALFAGQVQVEVHKNQVAGVDLVLQQVVAPGTVDDQAPYIGSIVVSNVAPATGEAIALAADVSAAGELTYQWTASCSGPLVKNGEVLDPSAGEVFSDPTSRTTSFTSYCTAEETITFTVRQSSDAGGRTAATSFTLRYSAQGGDFAIRFNSFPDILAIATTGNAQPPYGGRLNLAATVQDANGDAMSAEWKDNCGGAFDDATSLTPVWTAPQRPGGTRPSTGPLACKLALFVTDGQGGRNTGWLTVRVGEAAVKTIVKRYAVPRFAFVLNGDDSTVTAYTVDVRTGALTSVGSAATGTSPYFLAVDPSGRHAYVPNTGDNTISVFGIDAGTGALTAAGTPLPVAASAIAFAPSGDRAYVLNGRNSTVLTYGVDVSSGALTSLVTTSTLTERPSEFVVDPSGRFAFAALSVSNTVEAYAIDASGALSRVNSSQTGSTPMSLTVHPSGRFAYLVNLNSRTVGAYAIDAATGALTRIGSDVATGRSPFSLAVDPSGKYAFVANQSDSTISVYSINDSSGALTGLGAPVPAGAAPTAIGVDPSGKFLYMTSAAARTVSVFAIDATGALMSSATPAPTGNSPRRLVTSGVYPPPFAYVANMNDGTISTYTIDSTTGALTSSGPTAATAPYPWHMAVDPLGRFLFTVNYGDSDGAASGGGPNSVISAHAIDPATGALTLVGSVAEPYVNSIAVDPAGKFLYSSNNSRRRGSDPPAKVATYAIDQSTGALTKASMVDTYIAPWSIGVDPSGKFVYEVSYKSVLSTYSSDATTGALTQVDQDPTPASVGCGSSHDRIAIDPFGRFVYEVNCTGFQGTSEGSIGSFAIDPATGAVTLVGHWQSSTAIRTAVTADPTGRFVYLLTNRGVSWYAVDGLGVLTFLGQVELLSPMHLALDPSGQFLYVANYADNVATYAVDPFTGALTPVGTPAATGRRPVAIVTTPGKAPWTFVDASTIARPQHVVGGTVSGLTGTVVLTNRGADELTLTRNGTFAFAAPVVEGGAYDVQVLTQPAGQTCVVTDGAGVVGTADVLGVGVLCTTDPVASHTLGGSVTGLSGTAVLHNGGEDLTVTADGSFAFATPVGEGASYSVSVAPPASQTCSVTNGSGTMGTANVTDVLVACAVRPASTFGEVCTVAVGCTGEFNVCQNFPNPDPNYYGCTKHCTADTDCPSGSQGPKCNNQGLCRP